MGLQISGQIKCVVSLFGNFGNRNLWIQLIDATFAFIGSAVFQIPASCDRFWRPGSGPRLGKGGGGGPAWLLST
jgi:hypothetical protein